MNDERFEQLWSGLRESVKKARGERQPINTLQHLPFIDRTVFGGEIRIGSCDEDGSSVRISGTKYTASANASETDLLDLAAQCIAASIEVTEAKEEAAKVRPSTVAA